MRVLGIDPGINGAAAVYDTVARAVDIIDLPTTGFDSKRRINAIALKTWIVGRRPDKAVIEYVTAMPSIPDPDDVHQTRRGMGSASAFRFGDAVGSIRSTISCCDVPFELVVPAKWKRHFGLIKTDKEASRQKAIDLLPLCGEFFKLVKHHQRAEAALIAMYGAATLL